MKEKSDYSVIGLMSGTSLDGLDVAHCLFVYNEGKWSYQIKKAATYPYNDKWRSVLESLDKKSTNEIAQADIEYGKLIGSITKAFISKHHIETVDLIASHGHTVFHRPEKGITLQVGNGKAIASECNLPVVCDFRALDVSLGGQGAPLVPVGDKLLFSEYDYCLNLGGFANISYDDLNGKRRAFDICPANIVLNNLANTLGYDYDDEGKIAAFGNIDEQLLNELNGLDYYHSPPPKSLGKEWFESDFYPLVEKSGIPVKDKLRTLCEHIAIQIVKTLNSEHETRSSKLETRNSELLVTGGGAFNSFLMQRIKESSPVNIVIPDRLLTCFKEALVFAFLGVLKTRNEVNCLASVTGAKRDCVCGTMNLVN